ncbi:MAG: DUF1295 domain-containing protein [Nitriliruptorales bacterium]|nr:DUF1295 domain-containing protein [Nitriliruptorales bacterium]
METWSLALTGLAAISTLMVGTWVAALVQHDTSLVDRVWGLAFVVAAWVYAVAGDGTEARELLMAALVTIWGIRLTAHITWRNWGHGEDPRYAGMRERYDGNFDVASLWRVFLLQALLAWVVALPLLAVASDATPDALTWLDAVGVVVWAVGFVFEAVGDWQLARFSADPSNRGKVLDSGLWRYTRHPNYFGDATLWWGCGLVALATGSWWALAGPALMSLLIVRVSGVALTDRRMGRGSTREGYEEYVRRTNAFFPGPPSA